MSNEFNLMDVVQQTAFNVAGISEQMGIIKSSVDNLKVNHARLEDRVNNNEIEFQQYREAARQKERVEAEEVKEYEDTITNRVTELLKDRGRFDLFGVFKRKCWCDAKRHSYMLGKSGVDTKKMFHQDVINYIGTWQPHGYGTDGYIEHIDSERSKK